MNNNLDQIILSIIDKKYPLVTNLANVSAILKTSFKNTSWAGFYLVKDNTLFLGPFQGEVACSVIEIGKGVCGTAFETKETIIVENVLEFKGHIACSSTSRSEIVTPIIKNNKVVAVIDLDSDLFNNYTKQDQLLLEKISTILATLF
ncbi:MAG TPA: GAF domain-containing protein [Bacteroidales bacterium]|nr:GAF domain-containing protein [Candidatus Paceibacterota bacterium]HPL02057.1 GAF domain-containing protein [Bacteroidales bacterium]